MTQSTAKKSKSLRSAHIGKTKDGTCITLKLKESHYRALESLQKSLEKELGTQVSRSVIIRRALLEYLVRTAKLTGEQMSDELDLLKMYCR